MTGFQITCIRLQMITMAATAIYSRLYDTGQSKRIWCVPAPLETHCLTEEHIEKRASPHSVHRNQRKQTFVIVTL